MSVVVEAERMDMAAGDVQNFTALEFRDVFGTGLKTDPQAPLNGICRVIRAVDVGVVEPRPAEPTGTEKRSYAVYYRWIEQAGFGYGHQYVRVPTALEAKHMVEAMEFGDEESGGTPIEIEVLYVRQEPEEG